MTKKTIKYDARTANAIRTADQIRASKSGGKFRKGTLPMSGFAGAYSGPFAIVDISSGGVPEIDVLGGGVVLGLNTSTFTRINLAITASGYINITVTWDGDFYIFTLNTTPFRPAQSNSTYHIDVGFVTYEAAAGEIPARISLIEQHQYGTHYAAARVF